MSKERLYSELARVYKYSPDQIADMTPYQQLALMDPNAVADTLYFNTHEEYLEWLSKR